MQLDIYKNKLSVKPFTHWRSEADMYNFLEENADITKICQKIKETGDKSGKEGLPGMMPMGNVGDLTRKKENCEPTGLVMLDLDKVPDIQPVVELIAEKHDVLERLKVRFVAITPSYHGLRILCECLPKGFQETLDQLTAELNLMQFGGEVDPACKDLSRLSYLVPAEYILYTKDLFAEVPQASIEAMKVYKSTGTMEKHKNTQTDVAEVMKSDEEYKDFAYNGQKVADLVREYIEATGGDPEEGQRHPFYNNLVVQFRNLVNNDPKILHAVLPTFGNSLEETWAQCVGLCASNRTTRLEKNLYFFLKDRGYLLERATPEAPEEELEDEKLPPMPKLPPVFRQFVNAAPEDFKIPTIVALLPILGTLTSHLRADYFDDSEQSTEFISLVFAPPSSGKAFINRFLWLMGNIAERDKLSNMREEIWASTDRRKSSQDKGEEQPRVSVRIVKPLISVPELLTKMRDNHGHHMFIFAEELDTFNKGNRTTGGDKSDLWRVTWDNGSYGQYYKSTNTFKGEVRMYLNLLFTSTQDQIDRFFRNVEDGLVTRFSVCPVKNQQYAPYSPWKKIPTKEMLQIKNILTRLDAKVYKMPLKVDWADIEELSNEDFVKMGLWQYEFQEPEKVNMNYMYKPLLDWLEEERVKAALTLNPARDVFRRRAAVKGFRLALMCHGLYQTVGKKEQQVIINFVKWFCAVDLENSLYQFGQRYNELQDKGVANKISHNKVYNQLPETFDKNEVRIKLQRAGAKTPVKMVISLWYRNGIIEKNGDTYKKLKKL